MKKSVVIVEEDDCLTKELTTAINESGEIEVVGNAKNGADGITLCQRLHPDYVITDLLLSARDGISVLENCKALSPESKVIMISGFVSDGLVNEVMRKGAEYFMVKPISATALVDRIKGLSGNVEKREVSVEESPRRGSLEEKISKIFINVGIPPHIKGYGYLREGVKMAVNDPEIINSITKKLYPTIGEKYNTSASKVERAIRHAIEVAWNRGRIETINGIFGVRAYVGAEKPTNGEFIALVADKMLLEGV